MNYDEFAVDAAKWLNREGMSELTDQIESLTAMAQRRINRSCDFKAMEQVNTSFALNAQSVDLPSDFMRARALYITQASNYPVTGRSLHTVLNSASSGRPVHYATSGNKLYVGPTPDQPYTALFIYYAPMGIPSTSLDTNWVLENAPELLLFATLLEGSLFLKDDQRAGIWEGRFNQIKEEIELSEEREDKEGGGLAVNAH